MPRKNLGPRLGLNADGYYEIRWTENGRSKHPSTGTKNLEEAQQVLADFLKGFREVRSSAYPTALIVDACLAGKWANVAAPGRIADSMKPIKEYFDLKCITNITPDDCDEYAQLRRAGKIGEYGRKVADATINYELSMLGVAMRDAVKNNAKFPGLTKAMLPELKLPPKGEPREDWVTPEQYADLLPHIPTLTRASKRNPARFTRIYRFLVIAFNTAQRRRSIETLEWSQVNFHTGLIDFRKPGQRRTNKRQGVVPMSKDLRAFLEKCQQERKGSFVLDFPGSIRKTFDNTMMRASKAAGVDLTWITRHTIRRTWATWAAMRGVSLYDIADVLGDDYKTVEKHYRKYQPEHLRGAVEGSAPGLGIVPDGADHGALRPVSGASCQQRADKSKEKGREIG